MILIILLAKIDNLNYKKEGTKYQIKSYIKLIQSKYLIWNLV